MEHETHHKHKADERAPEEVGLLMNRLNRIEGQIRGIRGMLEKNIYCVDILTQVAAARAALDSFSRELLADHIRTCVVTDLKGDRSETVDELLSIVKKLMK